MRLELLTDPNLPNGGPGRSIRGSGRAHRISRGGRPGGDSGQVREAEDWPAQPPTSTCRRRRCEPKFDDKSGKRRVTGPVEFAIDGKDETAWGIDAGPGLRNQARKAVFVLAQPVENARGNVLKLFLKMNHGGANSDDNENNNLGRIRLSVTSAKDATADPLPASVREILAIPASQRTPAQTRAVFGYWRTTVPEWRQENDAIAALWRTHPEGSLQLVMAAARNGDHRPTHILKRGDFLQPDREVQPGTPAFLHPLRASSEPPPAARSRAGWWTGIRPPRRGRW